MAHVNCASYGLFDDDVEDELGCLGFDAAELAELEAERYYVDLALARFERGRFKAIQRALRPLGLRPQDLPDKELASLCEVYRAGWRLGALAFDISSLAPV